MAVRHAAELGRQTPLHQKGDVERSWYIVDAEGHNLGRLATHVATVLMGKHRPDYTPHVDTGDFVIITNAGKIGLTGRKAEQKLSMHYTRYPGGQKVETYGSLRDRRPEKLIEDAVRRMLPKNRLGRVMLSKLKVYQGTEHPHQAQQPTPLF